MKFKALVILALLACAASGLGTSSLPAFSKEEKLSDLAPGLYSYQDPNTGRHRKYYVPDPKYPEQLISDLKEQPLPDEYLDLVVGKKKDNDDPDRAAIDALLGKKRQKKESSPAAPKVEKKPEKPAAMEMSDQAPMEMSDQAPMEMPEAKSEPLAVPKKAKAKAGKKSNVDEPASMEGASDDQPLLNSTKEPSMDSLTKPEKKASKKRSKPPDESGADDGFFPGEKTVSGASGDPFDSTDGQEGKAAGAAKSTKKADKADKKAKVKAKRSFDEQPEDGLEQPKDVAADNDGSEPSRPEKVKEKVKADKIKPEKMKDEKPEKVKADKIKPEKVKADKARDDQGENFEGAEAAEAAAQAKKAEKAEKAEKAKKVKAEKPEKPEKPPKEKPLKPSKEKAPAVADDTGSGDGISDKIYRAPFAAGGKAGKFFGSGLKKTGKPLGKIHGFFFGPSDK